MKLAISLVAAGWLAAHGAVAAESESPAGLAGVPARSAPRADADLLVRRGAPAVLSTSQGGVAVESRVEVLQDGKAGQRVLVRGSAWPQPIAARVVGNGSLEPAR